MAVETGRPRPHVTRGDSLDARLPYRAGRQPPRRGAEFWWWVFMRVSGIMLLFLAVGHVLIMHVFGGGIDRVNFAFVALRWQSPFWRTWDWLLLSLALIHGVNGLRAISLDYIRRPGYRIATNWFFGIATIVIFALGTVVVFSFNACHWPGTVGIHCP
jgi:succinate dehydrogenase / fumarate reductase membrane anchor subunit